MSEYSKNILFLSVRRNIFADYKNVPTKFAKRVKMTVKHFKF